MLEGRTLVQLSVIQTRKGGKRIQYEDEHRVSKFKRLYESNSGKPVLTFYAAHGGERTIAVEDIVDIR